MTRGEYLEQVIETYLASPDTPTHTRRRDWAIAGNLYQRQIDLATVRHAIALATLRRHRRDPELETLEPVRSLAYFRPLIEHLHENPQDPGYVEYIRWSYENRLDWPFDEDHDEENGG